VNRQIILDTETTGLSHKNGHRIIEIGCVELIDRKLTSNNFHFYLNPERQVDPGAFAVHGLSDEFLVDKPFFQDIADDFVEFVDGAELVIHNAPFDVGFLDNELRLLNQPYKKLAQYCQILDTLKLARRKHAGKQNSLDALCRRYRIDNSSRDLHGALLDAQILSEVYLAMTGGQKSLFATVTQKKKKSTPTESANQLLSGDRPCLPVIKPTEQELAEHVKTIAKIAQQSGKNLWETDK